MSRLQTLRRMGFKPNAMLVDRPQLDRRLRKGRRHLAQQRTQTLLEVRLRLRVSLHMAWARHTQTRAEPPQIDPAQLTADRSPQALRYPGGDGAPVPAVVLRSRSAQRRPQLLVVRCRSTAVDVAVPDAAGL